MKAITIWPLVDTDVRTCRVCGCTDQYACDGGCWWVERDLCSACTNKQPQKAAKAAGSKGK